MQFPRLDSKAILAPMAGITNLPFRILCRRYGAAAVFTEMASADALVMKSAKSFKFARTDLREKPIGLQLFGSSAVNLAKVAQMMQHDFDFIDINMGCSAAKVIKQGAGVYLMKDPDKVAKIILKVADSIDIPLTVKIRSGFDMINAAEIARIAEDNGAAAVTVHPRTAAQGFSGKADWSIIRQVKENVSIPVIGNGDIRNPYDAERMLKETGCDYVMVGRAAIGNPFIFMQINEYLDKGAFTEQNHLDRGSDFRRYLELVESFDMISFNDIRVKAQQFTKHIDDSCRLRKLIGQQDNVRDIKKLMNPIV